MDSRSLRRMLKACAIAALVAAAPAAAEPVKIRIGWIAAPGQLVAIMFDPPGVAKHRGVTYDWEAIHFQASPNQITSLASGDLDIATLEVDRQQAAGLEERGGALRGGGRPGEAAGDDDSDLVA